MCNNPDVRMLHVTHCFLNFPAVALSHENVIEDYPVHRTRVGILKKKKHDINVYEPLLQLTKTKTII